MSTTRASIIIDASTERAIAEFQKLKGMIGGLGDAFDMVKGAAAALGGALSVGAFAGWIKGAIDAADEMSDLSQRTGLATNDISGLQIAFKMGGMQAEALQGNMSKLNRGIADGSAAFEAMGLSTRNADGSLKSTRQMLGEVADKFAGYQDGAAKSALAMDIFGKSGADMIPMLNGGSQALDEFDALARKLGLTLDEDVVENAGKFNDTLDLVSMGTQGVARQVAAQLLPTLSGLAGQFFESMTSGDKLANTAAFLSAGLKGLYVVALGVVEIFSTVGKTVGGVSAAIVAALTGDFKGAAGILKEMKSDIGTGWKDTLGQMQAAWSTTGNTAVEAMAKVQKSVPPTTKATDDAGKAAAKTADEYQKLMDRIYGNQSGTDPEFLKNLKLIETQGKKTGKTLEMIREEQQLYIRQQPYMIEAEKARIAAAEQANKVWDEYFDLQEKARLQTENGIKGAREMVEQLEFETKALRMSNTEREIAIRLRQLEASGLKAGSREYEEMAKRIREAVVGRDMVQASIDSQKAIRDEWKKTSDQIGQSFTDALMQGGKSVKEYLVSLFRTMVLRPILAPVGSAVSGILGSLLPGGTAMAGPGGGATDLLGSVGGLGDLGSLLGNTSMGALDIGGISLGGVGSFLGYAGLALGAIKLLKSFKSPGEQHTGGFYSSTGADGMDAALSITGGNDAYARDLIKRANPEIKSVVSTTVESVLQATQDRAKALGFDISLGIDAGLAANTNGKGKDKNTFGYFNITSGGEVVSEYSNRELGTDFAAASAQFAADMAEAAAKVVLAGTDFQKAGETAVQTLERLTAIQGMSEALNPLGGIFSMIANASVGARDELIALAGGIDTLMGQAGSFVKNYYSQDEQMGLQARMISDALAAVGIDASSLQERQDYRALVESFKQADLEDPTKQQQIAALLGLGDQFAGVSDYLRDNNLTLAEAIQNAPDIPILQSMLDPQQATAQATQQMSGQLSGIAAQLTGIQQAADAAAAAAAAAASAAGQAASAAGSAAGAASSAAASADLASARPAYSYNIGEGS